MTMMMISGNELLKYMNPYVAGGVSGICGAVVGHPFDTVKSNHQVNRHVDRSMRTLFKGSISATLIAVLTNSLTFGCTESIEKITNNYFVSGFITGGLNSLLINPLEYRKIQYQIWGKSGGREIFRGLQACFVRESIAWSVYFGVYHYLRDRDQHPAVAGAIVGPLSWFITYPIDVLKTKIQSTTCNSTYVQIIKTTQRKEFYAGLSYCLMRAFVVNAITFPLYEETMSYLERR